MDIQKAKRLLAKINVLVDNHDEAYSTLENDLLKTYIKELYECVSDAANSASKIHREPVEKVELKPEIVEEAPPRKESIVEAIPETVTNGKTEQVSDVDQPAKDVVTSEQSSQNEQLIQEKEADVADDAAIEPEVKKNGMHVPQQSENETTSDVEALFVHQQGNDLLSKLGSKPVTLIENTMGINDRILTINELFRGDHALFQQTVDTINRSESYDQVKEFLVSGIASELEWSSEGKAKKATAFIRLIQRKFSIV